MANRCRCGSGETYEQCCGPLHEGGAAPTAQALMRSRFTAFALGDAQYLLASWHPSTRPRTLELDEEREWTQLEIVAVEAGGPFEDTGVVEFRAHHRAGVQHERSRFVRHERRWYYLGDASRQ